MVYLVSDPTRHGVYRVTLNDQDVTALCVHADDKEGWCDVRVMTPGGILMNDDGTPLTARVEGRVRIERLWDYSDAGAPRRRSENRIE